MGAGEARRCDDRKGRVGEWVEVEGAEERLKADMGGGKLDGAVPASHPTVYRGG